MAVIEDTPRRNVQWRRDLSQDDVSRLTIKAGNKAGVCMISLEKDTRTVTVAHIISREKRFEQYEMQRLEHICGFNPGEFSVHSSSNLVFLRLDYHKLLDQGGWVMLPSLRIMTAIEQYYSRKCEEAYKKNSVPDFTGCKDNDDLNKILNYRIIPLGVLGYDDVVVRPGKVYRNVQELPEISSWVHPFYAIWHAGGYIDRLEAWVHNLVLSRLSNDDTQRVQAALRIYYIWKSIPLPPRFEPDFKPVKNIKRADADNAKQTVRNSVAAPSQASRQVNTDGGANADNNDHNSGEAGACADGNNAGNNVGNSNVHDHPHTTRSKTGSIKLKPKTTPSTTSKNAKNRAQEPGPSTDGPGRDQQEGEGESNCRGRSGQRGRSTRPRANTTGRPRSAAKSGKPGARTRSHK
ncbi:uncharacterized protein STEHIDRAFT_162497 [Stereum hirsutum FP-91666 SS1]|uniref:uncharacterized protein n=1 Tax=Stereum hirsutum (strain FP-91666) TaxID=721885 RepID=UPI0004449DA2|nr:uncharacterized protein STEHIDRAFT_162497 [Stereum hirsutum FP-91666 SS1]EIM80722.1 hypothetical protein STEHIDRAFT_162497 [Stereum hirsutum FP-91666 SS1]